MTVLLRMSKSQKRKRVKSLRVKFAEKKARDLCKRLCHFEESSFLETELQTLLAWVITLRIVIAVLGCAKVGCGNKWMDLLMAMLEADPYCRKLWLNINKTNKTP
jgi:hypothetical protein